MSAKLKFSLQRPPFGPPLSTAGFQGSAMGSNSANLPGLFTRRNALHVGATGLLGLTLPQLLHAQASAADSPTTFRQRIKSCILIFYYGGPSHLDTFDMKPDAPQEVRGEFQSIATSVPGLRIGEHLPHTSRVMHKVTIIRSMRHSCVAMIRRATRPWSAACRRLATTKTSENTRTRSPVTA